MPNYRRIVIVALLVCVLGVGTFLFFRPSYAISTVVTDQQTPLCQNSISITFVSNQSKTINCQTEPDSWIDVSLTSSAHNSTLGLTISLSSTGNSSDPTSEIYSDSGRTFSALLPVSQNGTTLLQITNLNGVNTTLKGTVNVYRQSQVSVPVKTPDHPYRDEGAIVIAGGGALLFLFGWDPRGFGSALLTGKSNTGRPLASAIRNVWLLRAISLIAGIIVALTLLAYSMVFLYSFKITGSVLSFYPWSFGVQYNDPALVVDFAVLGIIVAVVPLALFTTTLFRYVLPRLDGSFAERETGLQR